jgi:hypothetical protein
MCKQKDCSCGELKLLIEHLSDIVGFFRNHIALKSIDKVIQDTNKPSGMRVSQRYYYGPRGEGHKHMYESGYLDIHDASRYIGKREHVMYSMINAGKIPYTRMGRFCFFKLADLKPFSESK